MNKNRRVIKINKHVSVDCHDYQSLNPDLWILVNERLANGEHTKKVNAYLVDLDKLFELKKLIDDCLDVLK